MPEYDEAYALAQDALAAAEAVTARLVTVEAAFKQYVCEAPNGAFAARETALDILRGE
jgi:hypothetical protein